jgi:hypothetical protein
VAICRCNTKPCNSTIIDSIPPNAPLNWNSCITNSF